MRRALALLALVAALDAAAGGYPDRPVHFVVGAPPGSGMDLATRIVTERMREDLQQSMVVENRIGADGAIVAEEGYGNPDVDYIQTTVELEKVGVKTVGISNECTGRDGASQPLVALDEAANALVSTGNVSQYFELPPMPVVLGELESMARDGLSGGWEGCVRPDGSLVMENNGMFCSDHISGFSVKTCADF